MAPDSSSASAGKKLANAKHWKSLGQSTEALWGECQGSALYQVKVDLSTFTIQCSCPSRKQPCKHGLGLLLLTSTTPDSVPLAEPPEWVTSWLSRRSASSKRKEASKQKKSDASPSASQAKTADKRLALVKAGVDQLDLWLNDLIRNGLGKLETQPSTFWEAQAAKMIDAQAPGLASRVRRLSTIPNASSDWPARLLFQLGQLALLTQAFRRINQFDVALQEDIRQLIGWNSKEEDVVVQGEHINDEWLILGQAVEAVERGQAQHTWLVGTASGRAAQIIQFAYAGAPFAEHYLLGSRQQAELVFWPGVHSQRALLLKRKGDALPIQAMMTGYATIAAFFDAIATTMASLPWREHFLCTLNTVVPLYDLSNNQWCVCDRDGQSLPLIRGEYWQLLALSGGHPVDFAAEWDGSTLLPLGFLVDQQYHALKQHRM
jgi:hypothetical protein